MPPGMPFDITEANRDGPVVQVGYVEGKTRGQVTIEIDLSQPPDLATVDALITRGGCKACHTIPAFPDAVGVLGPAWCEVTKEFKEGNIDLAFIYQSIVDPNAVVEEGFQQNLMPANFGQLFTEDELKTLVAFIATQKCD
jgi:cytochrome c551/c552